MMRSIADESPTSDDEIPEDIMAIRVNELEVQVDELSEALEELRLSKMQTMDRYVSMYALEFRETFNSFLPLQLTSDELLRNLCKLMDGMPCPTERRSWQPQNC